MVELFFVTCLIAEPERCTERSLLFEERNGLFTCIMLSQNELARWVLQHPGDQVTKWQCRYAGEAEIAA